MVVLGCGVRMMPDGKGRYTLVEDRLGACGILFHIFRRKAVSGAILLKSCLLPASFHLLLIYYYKNPLTLSQSMLNKTAHPSLQRGLSFI